MVVFPGRRLLLTNLCTLQIVHVHVCILLPIDLLGFIHSTLCLIDFYLDCSVQRSTSKLVVILGIDDNLHHVMSVALKYLSALPFLIPVPKFDQHIICRQTKITLQELQCNFSSSKCTCIKFLLAQYIVWKLTKSQNRPANQWKFVFLFHSPLLLRT